MSDVQPASAMDAARTRDDMRRCRVSNILLQAYRHRHLRTVCYALTNRLEGGHFYSATLRDIFRRHHGVQVGAYSYGGCFVPEAFPPGVTVGRYVSVAPGVRVFLRNHPMDRLSMHPFFFNSQLGWLPKDSIDTGTLRIGHDSWIGSNATITPGCSSIGIGAVIAAGAVVTRDVPDFAVVGGNPARTLRFRFPDHVCAVILSSQWWERSLSECLKVMPDMMKALPDEITQHPLLSSTDVVVKASRAS